MTAPAADEPKVGAGKGRPYYCVVCKARNTYFGRLVFENELPPSADRYEAVAAVGGSIVIPPVPSCPNHKTAQPLLPC